ncbi:tRNA wybutosine-synthesizing protein 3 homolog [Plakobranchus ocellatus]|uniref:tRNA wybutosine-synthesizing protein 3 homolog n=1 Tax=Plakobranchus ocellatus TaxID=259542 RepID=A0AAV3YVS6_9GAST|nr:tRNA wybutosine-synthesizing protein 3 homolog [Plakobranchus ocellatus]
MEFERQKVQRLEHVDLSRKGSIDIALHKSVSFINALPQYFTTSSCSGRIILFENVSSKIQKKGCKWLHVTHDFVTVKDLKAGLTDISGEAVLKFEPMVMHVQCRTLEDAQRMHQVAVASGFRNSGISVGTKGKIVTAIRSTHSLEVPLSSKGQVLVAQEHLEHLVDSANSKMQENNLRIDRFYTNLQSLSAEVSLHESCRSQAKREKSQADKKPTNSNRTSKNDKQEKLDDDFNNDDSLNLFIFDNT